MPYRFMKHSMRDLTISIAKNARREQETIKFTGATYNLESGVVEFFG